MSYFLLSDGKAGIAGSSTPLIKKKDRQSFVDAIALLRQSRAMADSVNAQVETARNDAMHQGYADGAAAAEADLAAALQGLAESAERIEAHYAAQVAEAAYAATVAIIGDLEDSERVARLVSKAIAGQKDRTGLSVQVSPELQPGLAALLSESGSIPVVANASLGASECHVITANGRIIASLPVQLSVLRQRWGLEGTEARQ